MLSCIRNYEDSLFNIRVKAIPLPGKKNIKGEDAYFCAPKYFSVKLSIGF